MKHFLRPKEYEMIRAVGDVIYPEGGTIPYSAYQVGVPEFVDEYLAKMDPQKQRLIHMLLILIQWGPILFLRRARRFIYLSRREQAEFLGWMENSRFYFIRICLLSVRTLLGLAYLADARVLKAMGVFAVCKYPGDPRPIEIREVRHDR
jgi:hypothetical protein